MKLASFVQLAAGPCPQFDEVLLALSMELGPLDREAALDGLDEHARRLFGVERLSPPARVQAAGRRPRRRGRVPPAAPTATARR